MNSPLKLVYLLGIMELILLTAVGLWFWKAGERRATETIPSTISVPTDAVPTEYVPSKNESMPSAKTPSDCHRAGCSGAICTDEEGLATNCIWRREYSCYAKAECKRQSNGECGFTQTPELLACLEVDQPTAASEPTVQKETSREAAPRGAVVPY